MPDHETIQFVCSHCGQSIGAPAAMRGTDTDCPYCGKKVTIWKTLSETEIAAVNVAKSKRDAAGMFSACAGVLAAVAGISAFAFVLIGDEKIVWLLYAGGLALWLAPWFFLFGQLMYIRAAVEK